MLNTRQKVIKITRTYIHTIGFDNRKNKFKFDKFFNTDFLHLDKWYAFYYEGEKVIQMAVLVDREKNDIPYTEFQKYVDDERKQLKITAKEWNYEKEALLKQLNQYGDI